MIQLIVLTIQRFKKEDKGGALVFVGLTLLPLFLMLGLAVDGSFGLKQKHKLQMACDAAAKAGAANSSSASATLISKAQNVFAANITGVNGITGPTISINSSDQTITVAASIIVPNVFMVLGGIPTSTYNASATASLASTQLSEIAIIYEVSARFATNNFHVNICNALINFVNSLPNNVMVSITPIATEFTFDASTTVPSNLFHHLSMTSNDESADPGFYPLSTNYAWTNGNYNAVKNPYYLANGVYATHPTDADVITSYATPATCPGGYASCPPTMWPTKCPPTNKNTSCSQRYSYFSNKSYPILPLTLNKTVIVNYLNGLKAFVAQADGFFPSFISWGWRTLDPSWNDFWMINGDSASTLRSTGQYPNPYGGKQKSIILIFNGLPYWNDYASNIAKHYTNKCGDTTGATNGLNQWWMTAYGMVPVPTNYKHFVDDITCENKWYKTIDKSLGLPSNSSGYNAQVSSVEFPKRILNEVSAKFFRICNNIKAKNVDIYLLSNTDTPTLAPCCNVNSNAYPISNSSIGIANALNAVLAKISAKIN